MYPQARRKKDSKKHLLQISSEIERNWHYWRPIAQGLVKIDKEDYDREGPLFLMKLNAAINYRAKLEKEALEKAKQEQENER